MAQADLGTCMQLGLGLSSIISGTACNIGHSQRPDVRLSSHLHLETEGIDIPAESLLYFISSGVLRIDLGEETVGQSLVS